MPKLHQSKALILLGAGREKKIYAVPPYTHAEPLAFEDVVFSVEDFRDAAGRRRTCSRCGTADSFLDEFSNEAGEKTYQCSDSAYCDEQLARQPRHAQTTNTEVAA